MELSIVVPVFNTCGRLLREAASSILDEPSAHLAQLILVDDASTCVETRHTLAVLAASDARVLLLRNATNQGPASTRNRGIRAATAEWVGFLDADDVWLPGQMARLAQIRAAHPEARWIATRHLLTDASGEGRPAPQLPPEGGTCAGSGLCRHEGPGLTQKFLGNFWIHLGATLTQRRLCEEIGGFAEGLDYFEDMHFMARLSTRSALIYADCEGYGWRQHDAGLTANPRRLRASSLRMHALAARDPLLNPFARQIRWAHLSAMKGLAMNNLLAGRRLHAAGLAFRAWAMDPREWRALALFLRLCAVDEVAAQRDLGRYSGAERFASRLPL